MPSPLDPFLRQLLQFIEDRGGQVSHTVFLRDRPDDGAWPAGFLEVILTSVRARNFLRTMRGTGQTRHHHLTETGRRWLQEVPPVAVDDGRVSDADQRHVPAS